MGKLNAHHKINKDERELLREAERMENPTDRLGPGSLLTQQSHINSSRLVMANSQFGQLVSIKDPEQPLVPTGFENVLGQYSHMLTTTEDDYEVVAKFVKNQYNYCLILFDKKKRRYHAVKRIEMEEHSEGFSTKYDNDYIDSLEIGDRVKKGTHIQKSTNFDKYMNYMYGKNINVVYLVSTKVYEDGILAMNGVDKLFNTYRAHTVDVVLSDNEILLNLYGDDKNYQGFPLVGEKVKDGILAVRRRNDHSKAAMSLKKKRSRTIDFRSDKVYYEKGRVVDIDILTNKDPKKISSVKANALVSELYDQQQAYYHDLYEFMKNIVDTSDADPHDCEKLAKDAPSDGHCYTAEFSVICEEAHDFMDSSAYFADDADNPYGNTKIVIHLLDEEEMVVGSKFVGRSGNKGVIAKILPEEKSWHMEDGRPIHLVVAALGVVGRLNHAQLNEHSCNDLSYTAVQAMKQTKDLEIKGRIVHDLLKHLNPDEAKEWKKWYSNLDRDGKAKTCRKIERNGITIVQDPIDNADILNFASAYEQFPANWQRIIFEDGKPSMRKVICAKMFYVRLKQDPLEKYSSRSHGPVNPLTMLPAKSTLKKKFLAPYSDVAVRFGEMELEILMTMVNHPRVIADFMMENSTSYEAKLAISEQLYLGDPDDEVSMDEITVTGKKNVEWIEAMINVLGTGIEIEMEEAPKGQFFLD